MAILSNGKFYGFLCSAKETGQKLANGAKEYVENFVSGFAGHGWKIWEYVKGKWMLEIDSIRVRGQFTVFEMLVSKIRAIIGSQAITQGHAKVKSVIVADCEVHKELRTERYAEDFTEPKWEKLAADNLVITQRMITVNGSSKYSPTLFVESANYAINPFGFTVTGLKESIQLTWTDEKGTMQLMEITEDGEYEYPQSYQLVDSPFETQRVGIIIHYMEDSLTIKQGVSSFEYSDFVTTEPCYSLEIEDEINTISEYDFIKCQKPEKTYHVQVGSISEKYINIPISEFDVDEEGNVTNPPKVGDEIVQFGNSSHIKSYAGRHSAIYMHSDEGLQPAIDVLDGIYSKDWSDCLKVRMGGDLPGTNGDKGFYCVNGKLLFVNENGITVSVINPDGSASFARGKLSWTNEGSPVFSGTILLQIDENNVWKVTEEGENIIGNPTGKRIEIDGKNAEINVFKENGKEATKIEGNTYRDYTGIFTGEVPDFSFVNKEVKKEYPDIGNYNTNYDYYLIEEGGFWVNSDNIYLSWGSSSYSYDISLTTNSTATIQVRAIIYKMKNETTTSVYQMYTFVSDTMTDGSGINVSIGTVQRLLLEKGYYYRVSMKITSTVSIATPGNSFVTIKWSNADMKLYTTGYAASLFANGICLGSSPENMFGVFSYYDYFNEENMDIYFHSPQAGYKIEKNQAYIRQGGNWGLAIPVIATGRIYGHSNSVSISIGKSIPYEGSWNAERLGTGKYKIIFPASMKFSSAYSYFVMSTGYGTAENNGIAAIKACVFEQNTTYFILLMSDDATPNDGDCWFEIKYF